MNLRWRAISVLALAVLSTVSRHAVAQGTIDPVPDLQLSTVSFPAYSPQVATLLVVPDGTGPSFAEARLVNGQVLDRRLNLWALDGGGMPIANLLRTRWSLAWLDGGVVACPNGLAADHNTLANGTTEWVAPPYAGGHSQSRFLVRYLGDPLVSNSGLSLQVNSPDINGDLTVGLVDIVEFAKDYFGSYAFRSDLVFDGVINLSDVTVLASKMGADCP